MMKKAVFTLVTLLSGLNLFAQWVRVTPNPAQESLTSVRFFNDSIGYAVGNGGTILKTANAGTSWSLLTTNTTQTFLTVFPSSKDTVFAAGNGGLVLKSIDGGLNWNTLNTGTTDDFFSIYFVSSQIGYAAAGKLIFSGSSNNFSIVAIYKTINGGNSWTEIKTSDKPYRGIYFINSQVGFATGDSTNGIIKTMDGGQTWQDAILPNVETKSILALQFVNANLGYAVGSSGVLYKTINGGSNWTKTIIDTNATSFSTNATLFSVHFTDTDTGYAVGSNMEGIIYKTVDGGTTWTNQKFSISVIMRGVYFTPTKTGYVVGRFNGGVAGIWRQQGNFVPLNSSVETISNNIFNIYPNPFTNRININLNNLETVNYSIKDLNGKEVKTGNVYANEPAIELGELTQGIYVVTLINGNYLQHLKVIKE
jgi:photosystem II stability/assembly factor-like uncharacterized protein